MAISKDQRIYNMVDPDLCMFVSNLCNILVRDTSELSILGINSTKISELKALGDAFELYPPDDVYIGGIMTATQAKNEIADQVRETVRTMAMRVEAKWGLESGDYKTLKVFGMNKFPDNILLGTARNMHLRCTGYLTALTPYGLTSDMLDDFEDLNTSFELAINAVSDAVLLRDQKARERVAKGNELYQLAVLYSDFGKRVFAMSDPARYDDYIIYTPGPGALTAPTDLNFSFQSKTFTWSPVENATSYILQASTDGVVFFEIFSGVETEFVYVPVQEGFMWFRVLGHNSGGNGPWSPVLKNGYFVTLPPPVNLHVELVTGSTDSIKLTFDAVPSATKYMISRSTTNIGDGAGSFIYAGQSTVAEFTETLAHGHRYYYRCTAENSNQSSIFSSVVWLEVV